MKIDKPLNEIDFREITSNDVDSIVSDLGDDGVPDPRLIAYFEGSHHPHKARADRTGYIALADGKVIGYIAGHLTERFDFDGEVQYLFVTPEYRRRGIATSLLRMLFRWFQKHDARNIAIPVADDSATEIKPFVEARGATEMRQFWHGWSDISGEEA